MSSRTKSTGAGSHGFAMRSSNDRIQRRTPSYVENIDKTLKTETVVPLANGNSLIFENRIVIEPRTTAIPHANKLGFGMSSKSTSGRKAAMDLY